MNRRKRYCMLHILFVLIVLSITACNKKVSDSDENTAISYVPQYSMYQYTSNGSMEASLKQMFIQGEKIYCISMDSGRMDTLNIIDVSTGKQVDRLLGYSASYFRIVNGFAGFDSNKITLYDENFEETGDLDLKSFIIKLNNDGDFFSFEYAAVDGVGNIGIVSRNILYVLSADGTVLSRIECPDDMTSI